MPVMAKLSRAILTVLLSGRHAALGGRLSRDRATNLARIASAYIRFELEQEKGIGPARAADVECWLSGQGLSLRVKRDDAVSAIALAELTTAGGTEQVASAEFP
ncbi:MAG: hypothetical protein GY873_37605 [Bosea sp.]|uniref:hypothetical protein n=1 Tax=Bosea sp. (in: a-proteobacteria) TaxID=1871050 RepID=UPI00238EBCB4|nr:hypothetical protein [Bosea sp. (in: a-proteobacteria)]MCP4739919.1 hypothetical protein [Bosea sp. (in: a-proteobacteria)]